MIHEHRVLTTGQITQLAFGTTRAATARMATLYQYRAVDRFRPLAAAGSSPLHFILDKAGAMLLAAEDGITTADLGYRRDRVHGDRAVPPPRPRHRGERGLHRAGRRRPRQRRPGRPGVLVVRAALRRRLGRPRPPRRVRPLARAGPRPAGRRHRLLPRVRHRHRAPGPAHRQARRVRRPRRPHRHHHPRPVLAAEPRAARPRCTPGWPARRRTAPATPPPPRRSPASPSPPPPPAPAPTARPGPAWLPAGSPGPAPAARPARPARHRPRAGGGRTTTHRRPPGGLAWHPPYPVPPAWHALHGEPRPGQPGDD